MKTIKILLILELFFLGGISFAAQKEPSWLGKTWSEGKVYYFSGISSNCDNLQEAKEQAYMDAIIKAAEYIGMSISNKTISKVDNSYSSIDSNSNLSIEETFLSQANIKEFKYSKTKDKKFIGYVLVEYKKDLLEEEKNRRAKLTKERQDKIEKRKKIGVINISISKSINTLSAEIKQFLQQEGYVLGLSGSIPVHFSLIEERFSTTQKDIHICNFIVEVDFNGQISNYESRGFGKDNKQAAANARREWMIVFKEKFNNNQ